MGETPDQTRRELDELRAQMSERVAALRREAKGTARVAAPLALAAAGVGVLVLGVVVVIRHRHKAEGKRLVGTLKRLTASLDSRPSQALEALGSLPADALREVIERKPSEPRTGAKLAEVAVRSAVTTAVGFGLRELRERLVSSGTVPAGPAPGRDKGPGKAPANGPGKAKH